MKLKRTEAFEQHADRYDNWYDENQAVFESELRAIREQLQKLPANIEGIEVGLGSGRFASELNIKEGIEPVDALRQMAIDRGIEVMEARAEMLPYSDMSFDFVLFVTVSFLEDLSRSFGEAYRVLNDGGSILVGIIDKEKPVGQFYLERRPNSVFYKHARFYTVDAVTKMLKETGFKDFEYTQSLFGELDDIDEPQAPEDGYDKGGFVVIKATKHA